MPRPRSLDGLCRVIAIANQKGGVGKTTTAVNLSAALGLLGYKTTLIDIDPQGNASTGLGIDRSSRGCGSYGLLAGTRDFSDIARPTAVNGLSIVPAEPDLAGAEVELVNLQDRESRLKSALQSVRQKITGQDYIFIDCPPSLNLLSVNALVASDSVIIPLQSEFLALEGLTQVTNTIEIIRRKLNPELSLNGILLTMMDRRNNLCEQVEADVRGFFGASVYRNVVPRNVRLSEAPSHGMPIFLYEPKSAGAVAYHEIANEFLARDTALVTQPRKVPQPT